MVAVLADGEKGCAGHECRPCPNAVTNIGDGSDFSALSRCRVQRSGSHCSSPVATEVLSSGNSVAMVHPGGTRSGKLAPQHQVIGDTLAGLVFGQPVERFDAGGGEREQVVIVAAAQGEGVTTLGAGLRDGADGVGDRTSQGRPVPSAYGGSGTGRGCGTV